MNSEGERKSLPAKSNGWDALIGAELLVLLVFLAYSNSFHVPFILDDKTSITENATIWHLWPPGNLFFPPHDGETVGGRPVLNISLALNYAVGGTSPGGYHLVNLLIHAAAGLALLGIVRRTLLQPRLRERFGDHAFPLALAVAGIWTLHPLQTESVTYIVQRAESLMGLFYLLTLYAFIRGAGSPAPGRWHALAFTACLLGMATKEVMVSAPLVVLLYDRTFVAGTFREAWRKRRLLYLALASTWLLLAWLMAVAGSLDRTLISNVYMPRRDYIVMQFHAIVEYLRLAIWPSPLILDYADKTIHDRFVIGVDVLLVVLLLTFTVAALRRGTAAGFPAFCYFAILAPTSSIIAVSAQPLCDHRMYLPLAPVIALAVLGIYRLLGRAGLPIFLAWALVAAGLTYVRNNDYRSAVAIWTDTVLKVPDNANARDNLGSSLLEAGRVPEAAAELEEALRLSPDNAIALDNLGIIAFQQGRSDEAMELFRRSLRAKPRHAWTHYNYGYALEQAGHDSEAVEQYRKALEIRPEFPEAQARLAHLHAGK